MSTKTTFKRIALVAVAALSFGVLTSVAPATAAPITPTAVTIGTVPTAAVGVNHTTPVSFSAVYGNANDTFTVTVRVTSAPAGSAYAGIMARNTLATGVICDGTTAGSLWTSGACYAAGSTVPADIDIASSTTPRGVVSNLTSTATFAEIQGLMTNTGWVANTATDRATTANVSIVPDVAGTYTVLVSTSNRAAAAGTTYVAGDANASYTFTTGVAPTSATLAAVTGATVTGASATNGRLMKLTLNAGAALSSGQTIRLSTNNTDATLAPVNQANGATGTYAATLTLDNTNFVGGVAFFKLADVKATASTTVVTASGTGLLTSLGTLSTASSTTVLLAAASAITINNGVDAVRPGSGHVGGTNGATAFTDTAATTAASHTYGLTATTASATASVNRMVVSDTSGALTGIPGVSYETTASAAAGLSTTALGTVTFTGALLDADTFTARIYATNGTTELASIAVTGDTAEVTTAVASPVATLYATHGSSVVATILVSDQFGAAVANSPVTVSVTGRNATTASVALATDATGRASFTLADAGTAATVLTQSVVVFDTVLSAMTNVTVNYGVDRVSKVVLATPTTLDTAATGITYSDIDASSTAGASATVQTITATVTDVNGAVLVGVPVTFTTASEGAGIRTTTVTVFTGTAGTAAASVFGWTAGIKTFTATAGAISATGTVHYRQGGGTSLAPTNSATEARTISAVRSGNAITVTALDRFGNPVSGVPLWGTRTGNGTFGGGSNTNGQTTGANGTAEFLFNAGSADSVVTITAGSATATPAPCYAQTGHLVGMNVCSTATTQTAYTATTVGTTTTAQTGVGASFAPAGVSSVTVAVPADNSAADAVSAAADAAAEATDAANAATDAANAAAEAADAATAAAQDAADAVAALSTQVTELVSALRKQITSLTNLVIKIQRKVRA
jgi:trimeric autotransporter adhesin